MINSALFNSALLGLDFDIEKAVNAYLETERNPEPPVVFPDCPECLKYTDGFGFCLSCNERTVFL